MLALSSDGLDRSPPGKNGISGAEIEKLYRDSRIREIAEYCESDVVNTYRVWLRYELFRGRLSDEQFHGSEACLTDFIKARANTKPHLAGLRLFHPCQPKVSAGQLTLQVTEGQRHASRTVRRHALQYSRGGVTAGKRQNGAKLD